MIILLINIYGCSSTVDNLRDEAFTQGCVVVESQVKLGYFNQEGGAEVCKAKCSEQLPADFNYTYDNPRTGCSVKIGSSNGK